MSITVNTSRRNVNIGTSSAPRGEAGDNGWAPVLAVVNDGSRRVLQVVDWTGGEGTKPTATGFVTASGLSPSIGDGIDLRGVTVSTDAPSGGTEGDLWFQYTE